jgi:hypothetical protein
MLLLSLRWERAWLVLTSQFGLFGLFGFHGYQMKIRAAYVGITAFGGNNARCVLAVQHIHGLFVSEVTPTMRHHRISQAVFCAHLSFQTATVYVSVDRYDCGPR